MLIMCEKYPFHSSLFARLFCIFENIYIPTAILVLLILAAYHVHSVHPSIFISVNAHFLFLKGKSTTVTAVTKNRRRDIKRNMNQSKSIHIPKLYTSYTLKHKH